ncbi:hypothetical protein AXE80_05070 [Wenyingzhuangia fucanilytica]|uniref:Type 1 periplasmic binding fold superfamily protein n=1 Tax=Wenyingzhuangia fucanilytica TaxID=1790137 RepID=A0A1B1Y4J0_9FLAO|nr:hypothetical protein [Wenyingzhuangia fucanilytica]ANW95685.1 hypothetical protein AXE80_05070 [Wenyingzhuangia fucanilytica]
MKLKTLVIATFVGLLITSCKKDDPIIPNEEEVITTVIYTLTPVVESGDTVVLMYKNDGNNSDDGVYTQTGIIKKNAEYTAELTLLNETLSPAEDVTEEVKEEGVEHQFFFTTPTGLNITYADKDENDHPIGIESNVSVLSTFAGGDLTIILRHEPNKSAENVSNGDITNAGGGTDVEVTFTLNAQD